MGLIEVGANRTYALAGGFYIFRSYLLQKCSQGAKMFVSLEVKAELSYRIIEVPKANINYVKHQPPFAGLT